MSGFASACKKRPASGPTEKPDFLLVLQIASIRALLSPCNSSSSRVVLLAGVAGGTVPDGSAAGSLIPLQESVLLFAHDFWRKAGSFSAWICGTTKSEPAMLFYNPSK
jgi:hypothetical protein